MTTKKKSLTAAATAKPKASPKPKLELFNVVYAPLKYALKSDGDRYGGNRLGTGSKVIRTGEDEISIVASCGETYKFHLSRLIETLEKIKEAPLVAKGDANKLSGRGY